MCQAAFWLQIPTLKVGWHKLYSAARLSVPHKYRELEFILKNISKVEKEIPKRRENLYHAISETI